MDELRKRMYGSSGSSDMKFAFTSEDDAADSPRPRTALDALKKAAGTVTTDVAENVIVAEALAAVAAKEKLDKDNEEA